MSTRHTLPYNPIKPYQFPYDVLIPKPWPSCLCVSKGCDKERFQYIIDIDKWHPVLKEIANQFLKKENKFDSDEY